jgi:hypothetical protein
MVPGDPDVKFHARQSGNFASLALETFRARQSVSRRIDLLSLLLDVIKKANQQVPWIRHSGSPQQGVLDSGVLKQESIDDSL